MAKLLARDEMKRLALVGAGARLTELEREKAAILRESPNLRGQSAVAPCLRLFEPVDAAG